jgi:hypothetical protein
MFAARNFILTRSSAPEAAYIAAITAKGATVTAPQQAAISSFMSGEIAAGRWGGIKRLYFPVWGLAAANAICMKSLTSGTFVGGVTYSAGYVNTDGTTGYFLSDVSVGGAGCTLNGTGVFSLITNSSPLLEFSGVLFGSNAASTNTRTRMFASGSLGNTVIQLAGPNSANPDGSVPGFSVDRRGIIFGGRTGPETTFITTRNSSTVQSTSFVSSSRTLNSTVPMCFMAQNANGSIANRLSSFVRNGSWGMTDGLSIPQTEAFTLALRTLWETTTGLTIS